MERALRDLVRQRAGNRCEYCRLHQDHLLFTLQVEHIVAKKHRGTDDEENLALACDRCNLHKGTDLTGIDPETNQIVILFHPRLQNWHEHFFLDDLEITGKTATGRATVQLLNMNAARRVNLRARLRRRGELTVGD